MKNKTIDPRRASTALLRVMCRADSLGHKRTMCLLAVHTHEEDWVPIQSIRHHDKTLHYCPRVLRGLVKDGYLERQSYQGSTRVYNSQYRLTLKGAEHVDYILGL